MMRTMALGVDLGLVSQLEQMGYSWVNAAGEKTDPILLSKQMGADSVRLRVFVNPPENGFWQKRADERCMLGFCDAKSVLETAKRVKKLDMDLMLDFHYSDHFADPLFQDIPRQWEKDTAEELEQHVYEHTEEVLRLFRENGIVPEWVQVGNEINPGILLPRGGLKEAPKQLVRFLNRGYDAVKEVCPETKVITHLAEINCEESCVRFLDNFFANGGETDILGFSYYPYWYHIESDGELLYRWLKMYHDKYKKPVMITEAGGEDSDETGTCNLLRDCMEAVGRIPEDQGLGVFYWEPEVNREVLPDRYPLGAARLVGGKVLQYTKALEAYKK